MIPNDTTVTYSSEKQIKYTNLNFTHIKSSDLK